MSDAGVINTTVCLGAAGIHLIILLMEEILHHLKCIKPCKSWDFNYQPQLVQEFFHQQ